MPDVTELSMDELVTLYKKSARTLSLTSNGNRLLVTANAERFRLVIINEDTKEKISFTITSLHDIALLRDFVRRAERLLKDSVRVQK